MSNDVDLLSQLLAALSQRRIDDARRLGEEIADHEARKGHARVARRLRGALIQSEQSTHDFEQISTRTTPHGALLHLAPAEGLESVVLPMDLRASLSELVQEWRLRDKLQEAGVARRTKLLLHGAPGCGKTLTARALGAEMGLPVFVVKFDGLVGSYLGQTATRLRELFRLVESTPVVLVIDEIDALAQKRGSARDVGELDRIVISLMQELEHSNSRGLIVACSNLPQSLDEALWRRFDLVLQIPKPSATMIRRFVRERLASVGIAYESSFASSVRNMKSYADGERFVADMQRRAILKREME
jgi:SpoVK/Ycf46/Vps4 family AAA+-type ATPase